MVVTNWSIRHSLTIFVLVLVLTITGLLAYRDLPREAAPDITIPFVLVTTPYFGVSPTDIETLVTQPMEEELEQLKDVETITSTSAEGASIVSIEFEPSVDIDSALQKVRERVDAAEPELPADAEDPIITEISFSEFPVMVVNVSGAVGLLQLERVAEEIQDELERIPGVLEVALVGGLEREISVEADPLLLTYYGVTLDDVIATIQNANLNMPGGSMDIGEQKILVRVPGELERAHQIDQLVVRNTPSGPIRVEDVAIVIDGHEERSTYSRLNRVESVSLSISRRAGENVIRITDEAKEIVADFQAQHDERLQFTVLADVSDDIRRQLAELENNILTGLLLVAVVLLFFMGGLRNALFVAMAIPLSMLISFAVLAALGVTLNIVVLFSLVLALGMLVDNAIVIVENIYRHGTMNKTLVRAAMDGVAEVAWPVIASTATTVFAFVPLLFWPGIMGEFMKFLPLTVIIVLVSSLFVALVINPVFCAAFMRIPPGADAAGETDELAALPNNALYVVYGAALRFSVGHRALVSALITVVFFGTFYYYGQHNYGVEFFPSTTPERIYVNVTIADGSNVEASDRIVRQVERALAGQANIENVVADVGSGNGGQMDFGAGGTAPHRSRVTVDFVPLAQQVEHPDETLARLREAFEQIVGADVEIAAEENGPPSGPPVNLEIVGDDYAELGRISQRVEAIAEGVPGVVNLSSDFQVGRSEIRVRVDKNAAALADVNTFAVANTIRAAISGVEASTLRDGVDEHDIVVRLQEGDRDEIEDLEQLRIESDTGSLVPLTEVSSIEVGRGFGSIRHADTERVVTVSADVEEGFNANAVLDEIRARIEAEQPVPAGYELRYTGQNEEQADAQQFLGRALLSALFLIALVLITQFNSVLQPGIILGSVVLSLLGVLWGLLARGMPFNIIMTGVGIISLAGVVVNNSIVLIDYANQLQDRGLTPNDAVIHAGLIRFRPVMLTAITTMLSLLPTVLGYNLDVRALEVSSGGTSVEMWGPMATAVVAGLAVATILTLIVVPVMYSVVENLRLRLSKAAPTHLPTAADSA